MASIPGRQKPEDNLIGHDPDYHPNKNERGWWDKDAMLNNCSAMMLSGISCIKNWPKFLEYFWHNKNENQDLQTPGMIVVTLSDSQTGEIKTALKNGFEDVCYFPSCHEGHRGIVMLVKINPIIMERTDAKRGVNSMRKQVEYLKERIKKEEEKLSIEISKIDPPAPVVKTPKRKPQQVAQEVPF